MRGKKPFTLAIPILGLAAFLTIIYALGLKNVHPIGDWIKTVMLWGFMIILTGSVITYLNWSEAKRRV
jgi:hypothetical protein